MGRTSNVMANNHNRDERIESIFYGDRLNTSIETASTAPMSDYALKSPSTFSSMLDSGLGVIQLNYSGSFDEQEGSRDEEGPEFVLDTRRWMFLFSFAVMSFSSSWMWITFSPFATAVAHTWNVPTSSVDALAAIYLYVYVFTSSLSLYLVVNYLGLHRGLLLGATLNTIGASIRYFYVDDYSKVYIGTFIAAYAQTFTLSASPLIAGSWFGPQERATATSWGVLANQLGTAVGLGATIFADFTSPGSGVYPYIHVGDANSTAEKVDLNTLQHYLGAQLVMSFLGIVLVATFGGDEPGKPPSRAAQILRSQRLSSVLDSYKDDNRSLGDESSILLGDALFLKYYSCEDSNAEDFPVPGTTSPLGYLESTKIVLSKWRNLAYLVAYGLPIGVFYTIPTFLSQLLTFDGYGTSTDISWSPAAIGWVGLVFQLSGVTGCLIAGRLVDRIQEHLSVLQGMLGGAAISLLVFLLAATSTSSCTDMESSITASVSGAVVVGLMGSGLCLAAAKSVGIELGTSIGFPADESAVGGMLECSAKLWGFVMVTAGAWMMENTYEYADGRICLLGTLAATVATALFITVLLRPQTKRPI